MRETRYRAIMAGKMYPHWIVQMKVWWWPFWCEADRAWHDTREQALQQIEAMKDVHPAEAASIPVRRVGGGG